jgi:hypothetical protein
MGVNCRGLLVSVSLLLGACGGGGASPDSTPADVTVVLDASSPDDAGGFSLDQPSPADREFPTPDSASSFDVGPPTDVVAAPDAGSPDAGPLSLATLCVPGVVPDLDVLGTRTGATTHYTGSNASAAPELVLHPACVDSSDVAYERVLRYVPRTETRLRVSTDNPGTDFDTVVWVQHFCDWVGPSVFNLGCDNDSGAHATSVIARTDALSPGVPVFILVAGHVYNTTGTFELTVTEQPVVGAGAACDAGADACGVGLRCIPSAGGSTTGTCIADGSLGGACRFFSELACNAGLGCDSPTYDINARCRPSLAVGAACGAGLSGHCPSAAPCVPERARCTPTGGLNGFCHITGAACDVGLGCTGPVTSASSRCRPAVAVGAACDIHGEDNVCPAGSSCIYRPDAVTCVVDGTVNALCRLPGETCDPGLRCYDDHTVSRCRTVLPLGAACSFGPYDPVCEADASCRDLPGGARCTRRGTRGGLCRLADAGCEGDLQCQRDLTESVCRAVLHEGEICDATGATTSCIGVWACSAVAGEPMGHCAAPGTAAGAECRDTTPRCAAGLGCSTELPAPGYCRRTLAAPATACDWTGRSTICPGASGCVPTGLYSCACIPAVEET